MSQKIGEKKEHFSIRKLTVGAASVLIGTSLYLGGQKPATVHADPDDGSAKVTQVRTDQTEQKTSLGVKKDSETSDADVNKKGTTSAGKEETHYGVNESKKNTASEETKGVQSSEQKEPAKAETGDKTQKEHLNRIKGNKIQVNSSLKENDKKSNSQQGLDGPKDIDSIKNVEKIINKYLGTKGVNSPIIVNQIITYHNPDGTENTIVRSAAFSLVIGEVKVNYPTNKYGYSYQLHYYAGRSLKGSNSYDYIQVLDPVLNTNGDEEGIFDQIVKFKNDCDNQSVTLPSLGITQIKGYTAWSVSDTRESGKRELKAILNDAEEIPEWDINDNSIYQHIDIRYRPLPTLPTNPNNNPTEPTEPTQPTPQTKPQPTIAPVHPQQPNKPGSNVKPKPEKPAAPNHHTNQHNNNSGSIKPKAQKMSSKAPLNKSVKRANIRIPKAAHTTTQTVAPKAQTPTVKKAAKAVLPQTGENNSLSKAAILLGGAAAVIGLIGLAATRKHIF